MLIVRKANKIALSQSASLSLRHRKTCGLKDGKVLFCSIFSLMITVYCEQKPLWQHKKGKYPMTPQTYEKEHLRRLRKLLPECTVLLKRDGRFPLNAPGEIALYGSGARNTIFLFSRCNQTASAAGTLATMSPRKLILL